MKYIKIKSMPKLVFAHAFQAPNYNYQLQPKQSMIEVGYVKEGQYRATDKNTQFEFHEGDIFCWFYDELETIYADNYHCHHTLGFRTEFSLSAKPNDQSIPLKEYIKASTHSARMCKLIDDIIRIKNIQPENSLSCTGLFLYLLDELGNECRRSESHYVTGEYSYVRKAKQYIYENISRPIHQKEIAEYLGITPEYLCSVFKKVNGESLIKFVNRKKLENIRELMKKEHIPLYQAAELFGFSDANYVSRLYKQYYNVNITHFTL